MSRNPLFMAVVLLSLGTVAFCADAEDRDAVVRAVLSRSRELSDARFSVPLGLWKQYLRETVGEAAAPTAPVAVIAERAVYHLTVAADGAVTLGAEVRLRVFEAAHAGGVRVFAASLAWTDVTLGGKPTKLPTVDGWLCFAPDEPGEYVLTGRAPIRERGAYGGTVRASVPATVRTAMRFDSPGAWDVSLEGAAGRIVGDAQAGTHGELATPPRQSLVMSYRPPAPPIDRPPQYRLSGPVAWNIDAGRQQVAAAIDVAIVGGATDTLELRLPAGATRLNVAGPDVREVRAGAGSATIHLRGRITGQTRLSVNYDLPAGDGHLKRLAPPKLARGAWSDGHVVVTNTAGGSELLAESLSGLRQIALADIPDSAGAILAGPAVLAAEIAARDWSASVEVVDLGEFALRESIADLGCFQLMFRDDGTVICRARYEIRSRMRQFLRVELPRGARVLLARVNETPRPLSPVPGETDDCATVSADQGPWLAPVASPPSAGQRARVRGSSGGREKPSPQPSPKGRGSPAPLAPALSPHQNGGRGGQTGHGERHAPAVDAYLLPLVRSKASVKGLVSFPVEVVCVWRADGLGRRGTTAVTLPRIDLPIAYAWCETYWPEEMTVRRWAGLLEHVERFSSETAAASMDYGKAELAEGYKQDRRIRMPRIGLPGAMAPEPPPAEVVRDVQRRQAQERAGKLLLARNYYRAGKDFYDRNDYANAETALQNVRNLAPESVEATNAERLLANIKAVSGKMALKSRAEKAAGVAVKQETRLANRPLEQRQQKMLEAGFKAAREGRADEAKAQFEAAEALGEQLVRQGASSTEQHAVLREAKGKLSALRSRERQRSAELRKSLEMHRSSGDYEKALDVAKKLRQSELRLADDTDADGVVTEQEISKLAAAVTRQKYVEQRQEALQHDVKQLRTQLDRLQDLRRDLSAEGPAGQAQPGRSARRPEPAQPEATKTPTARPAKPEDQIVVLEDQARRLRGELAKEVEAFQRLPARRVPGSPPEVPPDPQPQFRPAPSGESRGGRFAAPTTRPVTLPPQELLTPGAPGPAPVPSQTPPQSRPDRADSTVERPIDELERVRELVRGRFGGGGGGGQGRAAAAGEAVRIYALRSANATEVARAVEGVLRAEGERAGRGPAELGVDARSNAMIVRGDARQQETVRQLLTSLDLEAAQTTPRVPVLGDTPVGSGLGGLQGNRGQNVAFADGHLDFQKDTDGKEADRRHWREIEARPADGGYLHGAQAGGEALGRTTRVYDIRDLVVTADAFKDSLGNKLNIQADNEKRAKDIAGLVVGSQALAGERGASSSDVQVAVEGGGNRLVVTGTEQQQRAAVDLLSSLAGNLLVGGQVLHGENIAGQRARGLVPAEGEGQPGSIGNGVSGGGGTVQTTDDDANGRLREFIRKNYAWQWERPVSGYSEALNGTAATTQPAAPSQTWSYDELVGRLRYNWGQKINVSSVNLNVDAATADRFGVTFSAGNNDLRYAVVDEAQFRTLMELDASRRAGGRAVAANPRGQETIVGTDALIANGMIVNPTFAGDRGNTLDINDNGIVLPHEQYVLIDNGAFVTVVRAGEMAHWTQRDEGVQFAEVPQDIEVPRVGALARFEKKLVKPGDDLVIRVTYLYEGDDR